VCVKGVLQAYTKGVKGVLQAYTKGVKGVLQAYTKGVNGKNSQTGKLIIKKKGQRCNCNILKGLLAKKGTEMY
jgi:hypothetical protein